MDVQNGLLTKRALLKSVKELPDQFTIDELMERLIVIQKVERGLKEMAEGKGVSTEEARKRLARWLT
jgi:predicted transcriptional regulator